MNKTATVLNAYNTETIAMANLLRGPAQGLGRDIGNAFTIALSDGWKQHGVDGVRGACWNLMHMAEEVVGSWDVFIAARAVTYRHPA